MTIAASVSLLIARWPTAAYADACTSPAAVQSSSLPFTGLRVAQIAAVGIMLVGAGALLLLVPRAVTAGWARLPRPRRTTVMVLGAVLFAVAVLIPGRAVALTTIANDPCTTVGVVTSSQTADPPAVVPEAPLAALIPLTGAGVAAVVIARRRRALRR